MGTDRVVYKPPAGEPKEWHDPIVKSRVVDGVSTIPIGDKNHVDCYHETPPKSDALKKLFK